MKRLLIFCVVLCLSTLAYGQEYDNYSSQAAENAEVIKTTGGRVFQLVGFNGSASDQYIQLHNTASIPANGAIPYRCFIAVAGKNFSFEIPDPGLPLSTGITVCNSSTSATKTIGSADCLFYCLFR